LQKKLQKIAKKLQKIAKKLRRHLRHWRRSAVGDILSRDILSHFAARRLAVVPFK
jgi:hypothetical protein